MILFGHFLDVIRCLLDIIRLACRIAVVSSYIAIALGAKIKGTMGDLSRSCKYAKMLV